MSHAGSVSQPAVHLTREGVSLVLAPSPHDGPVLLHWGPGLGDLSAADLTALVEAQRPGVPHSALDRPRQRGVLGQTSGGFTGTPALRGYRPVRRSGPWSPHLTQWSWSVTDRPATDATATLTATDAEAGWGVAVELELTTAGVVRMRTSVTNVTTHADDPLVLDQVRDALPVAARATELLDLTGRWVGERRPQRRPWLAGTHVRDGRHGRTGHDATLLLAAGTAGFGFGAGEVWAVHVAWSGDHTTYAERTPEGECLLGGGELLGPGEVELAPGETYIGPWLVGAYAADGLDGRAPGCTPWCGAIPRCRARGRCW